jgi:HK97 family phage major capsid protein
MNPTPWYRFDNAAANARVVDINIIDYIGGWGDEMFGDSVTAKTFVAELSKIPDTVKTIRLHVNSPGGDVFSAVNIANALRDQRVSKSRSVEVIIEGLAASAASIVIMAGSTIRMADNALVMIHNPMTFSAGDSKDMRTTADELDKVRSVIIATYRWKSPLSEAKLGELMDATTWMDVDEALTNGFATEKIKGLKAAASYKPEVLDKLEIPDQYRARLLAITNTERRPAASGTRPVLSRTTSPGVSGLTRVVNTAPQDRNMKTITERLEGWQNSLVAKNAELNSIQDKVDAEGRGKDEAEREKFDTLKTEIEAINRELADLRDMEKINIAAAKPVAGDTLGNGTRTRGSSPVVSVQSNLPPGIEFTRMVMCKVASFLEMQKGNFVSAEAIARSRYPDCVRIHKVLNAAVGAGVTEQGGSPDSGFAASLVYAQNLENEFVEFLRPQTIIGRIEGLRRVPFNIRYNQQTSKGTGYWVGEGAAKPLTSMGVSPNTLLWAKVACIAVITQELARFSSPSAETMVRDELARAIIERMDIDFIDPNKALVSGVSPASITNGVTPIASSGTEPSAVRTDFQALFAAFLADNQDPTSATIIMPSATAMALSLMQNALGQAQFPGITLKGGTFMGLPVVTSQYVTDGSPGGAIIILVNANEIFLADDGQVSVDVSREASLEMSNTPQQSAVTGTGAQLVSMFQTNSLAIRAERMVNWARRREESVQYLSNVAYSATGSPS